LFSIESFFLITVVAKGFGQTFQGNVRHSFYHKPGWAIFSQTPLATLAGM
jgi:hypothetical protein